jgi:hypothetical protein
VKFFQFSFPFTRRLFARALEMLIGMKNQFVKTSFRKTSLRVESNKKSEGARRNAPSL